mgnify:CR=1 FL=1
MEMEFSFIPIATIILENGRNLKLMVRGLISIFKEWDLLARGKMITSMDKARNTGKTELFSKESFFKDLKSLVNFHGQMEHHT